MTSDPAGTGLAERFASAWLSDLDVETAGPALLPQRLARACVAVLPVAAAGLSLVDDRFRIPLAASDDTAALAERLQFSQGEGPCLEAALHQRSSTSRADEIARRWPALAAELFARTPYRAIVSLPLHPAISGAADLYLENDDALHDVDVEAASVIGDQVGAALRMAQSQARAEREAGQVVGGTAVPSWLTAPSVRDRMTVWVAMGMVMHRQEVGGPDALAVLRAYAFGHGLDLDTTAARLVHGDLPVDELA